MPTDKLPAPMEVGAVEVLEKNGPASKALRYAARESRALSEAAVPALEARLRRWGYGPGALERVLNYIRDEAAIVIHIDLANRLGKMQKDTHYRNQFETGITSGSNDLIKRKTWEDRLFPGIYETAEPRERVKYGVLNMVNDPCGISTVSKQYGKDYLVLRGVRLRTTFSDRDSCNKGQLASCEWYAHVLERYSELELRAVAEVALGDRLYVDSAVLDTAAGGYKEVQIHGELVFRKHVEAVVVHPSRRTTPLEPKIRAWCRDIGARMEFMPGDRDPSSCSTNCPQSIEDLRLPPDTPVWMWRARPKPLPPEGQPMPPWVRFDAFASGTLEGRLRSESSSFPAWPVGELVSLDLVAMTASADVNGDHVELDLRRCTAGAGAYERARLTSGLDANDAGAFAANSASIGISVIPPTVSRRSSKTVGGPGAPVWEWCASVTGNGAWCAYAQRLNASIEAAFQKRSKKTSLSIGGKPYEVDLELMVQINCSTNYRRLVRRTQLLA